MHARGSGVDNNGCCSGPRTPHRAHHVMDDGEPPRPVEEPHNGEQCVRERLRGRPVRRRRGQDWAGGTRPWCGGAPDKNIDRECDENIGRVSGLGVARTGVWDNNGGSRGGARRTTRAGAAAWLWQWLLQQ